MLRAPIALSFLLAAAYSLSGASGHAVPHRRSRLRIRFVEPVLLSSENPDTTCRAPLSDPRAVMEAVSRRRIEVRACYETALRENASLRGRFQIALRIDQHGDVEPIAVTTPIRNDAMIECIRADLATLHVPPTVGGCAVYVTMFNFTPRP